MPVLEESISTSKYLNSSKKADENAGNSSEYYSSRCTTPDYSVVGSNGENYSNNYKPLTFLASYLCCNESEEEHIFDNYNKYQVQKLKDYYYQKQYSDVSSLVLIDDLHLERASLQSTRSSPSENKAHQLENETTMSTDQGELPGLNNKNATFDKQKSNLFQSFVSQPTNSKENSRSPVERLINKTNKAEMANEIGKNSYVFSEELNKNHKNIVSAAKKLPSPALLKDLDEKKLEMIRKDKLFYKSYIDRGTILETVNLRKENPTLKLWIPISKFSQEQAILMGDLSIKNFKQHDNRPVLQRRGLFDGMGFMPKVYGYFKIPALAYHTALECKENIILILGGFQAHCDFLKDGEALKDFYVSKLQHLPLPLTDNILKNPNMVTNKYLYKFDTITNTTFKIKPLGDVPPSLICSQATKLNNRLVFYYGGLEFFDESKIDEKDPTKLYLKRRTEFNRFCYILNTETGVFKRIKFDSNNDVNVETGSLEMPTRFGHSQVLLTGRQLQHFEQGHRLMVKRNKEKKAYNSKNASTVVSISQFLEFSDADADSYKSEISSGDDMGLEFQAEENKDNVDADSKIDDTSVTIFNILIFGGYNCTNKGKTEPVNDMWLIKIYVKTGDASLTFQPTATATPIKLDTHSELPIARAYHSTTLIEPEQVKKKRFQRFSTVVKNFNDLITEFEEDNSKFSDFLKMTNEPNFKNNKNSEESTMNSYKRMLYSTDKKTDKNNCNKKKESFSLLIHGGYNKKGEMLDDFWFFDFKLFQWFKKSLFAKTEASYFIDAEEKHKKPERKKIHLKLAAHKFITKGKFLIALGGILDGGTCDFKRHLKNKTLITVLYLPDMEALDITATKDSSSQVIHDMFTGEDEVVKCANGTFYVVAGIARTYFDKKIINSLGSKNELLVNYNSYETENNYVQMELNEVILGFIAPTFTNLS